VYLRLGDPASAEREARTARDLKGDAADYLPVLIDALLPQKKFKDLYNLIEPGGDRDPFLESKVRVALGTAALRLGYDTRAEALLRDAVLPDPGAIEPRAELARFLNGTRLEEADRVIDEAIAANQQSAQPLQVKGELQWSRGDPAGAVRLFDEALKIDPEYQVARLTRANANVLQGIGDDLVGALVGGNYQSGAFTTIRVMHSEVELNVKKTDDCAIRYHCALRWRAKKPLKGAIGVVQLATVFASSPSVAG
jgi:tetratricopeptide (TPR) repeat protein